MVCGESEVAGALKQNCRPLLKYYVFEPLLLSYRLLFD